MTSADFYDIFREQAYPTPLQNCSLLPLLLVSLSCQKNSPTTKSVFRDEYDYIVVGAGSAGSVVASRLSEKGCATVLLLEAGESPPLLTDVPALKGSFIKSDIDWKYMTEPQAHTCRLMKNRTIPWPSGKTIGGSSVLNGMLYLRGRPETYDEWEDIGAEGWGWNEMLPYFLKSEDNEDMEFCKTGYHSSGGPMTVERFRYETEVKDHLVKAQEDIGYSFIDPNGPVMIGASDYQGNLREGQRCSTAKAYLVPAENRTNLDIMAGAFVTKILIDKKTAYGVQFDYKGSSHKVKARKEVILSAGTFNSAQLLLLSGIGPRRTLKKLGIPLVANLPVGKHFQDHGSAVDFFTTNITFVPTAKKLQDHDSILEYINHRSGILASTGVISLSFLKDNRKDQSLSVPDYGFVFRNSEAKSAPKALNIPEWVYKEVFSPYEDRSNIWCFVGLGRPQSKGYVSIKSSDPYEKPVIQPNYLQDPEDIRMIVSGLKTCRRILTSPELARFGVQPYKTLIPGCEKYDLKEDKYLECLARSFFLSGVHQVGTAKMGDSVDPTCVTDTELKVKGIKGLRVIDASVMPIIPIGATNNPVIVLAEKASDLITRDMCTDS